MPNVKVGGAKSEIVREIPAACSDEMTAVEFMERQRWGDTPACPRCGDCEVVQMKDKDGNRNKRFLWRCKGCKKQFTVRVGTIMEDSPIPLRFWCLAFYRACASKKGVSALQIKRETGLTYKSALFMMHRIRYAMAPAAVTGLDGTVEIDETWSAASAKYVTRKRVAGLIRARVITRLAFSRWSSATETCARRSYRIAPRQCSCQPS
jgi:transposase-like protein